jgi:hypothetical protein
MKFEFSRTYFSLAAVLKEHSVELQEHQKMLQVFGPHVRFYFHAIQRMQSILSFIFFAIIVVTFLDSTVCSWQDGNATHGSYQV